MKKNRIVCQLQFLEKVGPLFGICLMFDLVSRMLHSLQSESAKSEDAFAQLQEIQESVRLALLNCLLDFAGMKDDELSAAAFVFILSDFHIKLNWKLLVLIPKDQEKNGALKIVTPLWTKTGHLEHIGSELTQNRSDIGSLHFQNGYSHEPVEKLVDPLPGSIFDPHQQLLMVLSNIGYCKDELALELYGKYKYIWLQSRYI